MLKIPLNRALACILALGCSLSVGLWAEADKAAVVSESAVAEAAAEAKQAEAQKAAVEADAAVRQADTKAEAKSKIGGSLSFEPAFMLPAGALQDRLGIQLGFNLAFDIGVNADWSVIFGGGYNELPAMGNPDFRFMLVPAYFGLKSKNQFQNMAEIYWSMAGALYYEKIYMMNQGVGAQENLDGGAIFSAGYDVWWSRALLTGVEAKFHFIFEQAQIYPFVQLAFRFGFRG